MKKHRVHVAACLNLAIVFLFCALSSHAQRPVATGTNAIVPPLVNFSGVLADGNGKPLTDVVGVTFALYQEQQGGAPLWLETQNVQPDATGHYSVMLGAATSNGLPSSLFATGEAHWLGVQVQGQEEQPRVLLVSAPYALKAGDAETIGGLPPSAFLLAAPGTSPASGVAATSSSSAPAALGSPAASAGQPGKPPLTGTGTTNFIPIWTSSTAVGSSKLFQAGTNVGLGTTTPAYPLDVAGNIKTRTAFNIAGSTVLAVPAGDTSSIAVGYEALNKDTNLVGDNTAMGYQALFNNTTGGNNTATGYQSLDGNTTGSGNTATGYLALLSNTTGSNNTAIGYEALDKNTTASGNTATGHLTLFTNKTGSDNTGNTTAALYSNTTGSDNTASGHKGLYANTTGNDNTAFGFHALDTSTTASDNTAEGVKALNSDTTGGSNTANGYQALYHNTTASDNTGGGYEALFTNTTGSDNTANGYEALLGNTTASDNTADGYEALFTNTTGSDNTASGYAAMGINSSGSQNTAIGNSALDANSSGNNNIAIGYNAASSVSGGNSNNIHIGSVGSSTDSGTIRIGTSGTQTSFFAAGVRGITTGDNDAIPVVIDSNGQLGTVSSSRRFKEDIQDMGGASEGLMRLHPVTFRYKQSFNDGSKPIQYGLIAEEVAEVYPDLVAHSADGQIETVKYQVLDPMLLNEVQRQQVQIRGLQERLEENEAQRQEAEIGDLEEGLEKMETAIASKPCAASSHAQQTVAAATNAIVPPLVSFSGALSDANGKPLTDVMGVTFALYQEQQGGAPLWLETQNVQPDATGHYSVMLGAATSNGLPSSLFATGEAHWLGVQVQGQEEQPRVLLVSAPYALKAGDAETIGGLPPSAFLLAAPGTSPASGVAATSSSSAPAALGSPAASAGQPGKPPLTGTGTTNYIPIWTSSTVLGNSTIYQATTEVGIGTTTPGSTLDVSGYVNTSASYSTAYGSALAKSYEPLLAMPGGLTGGNTAVNNALVSNTSGVDNTADGYQALFSNTTASNITATGASALSKNTTGAQNMATGYGALFTNTTGGNNTATGYEAIYSSTIGQYNSATGSGALFANTTAMDNSAEGFGALHNDSTSDENTASGYESLYSDTTGTDNTASGHLTLFTNSTGSNDTATGFEALYRNTTGSNNTASGYQSLYNNSTASNNTASGYQSLYSNTTGNDNTASGENSLFSNTIGSQNTASGLGALQANTTGSNNAASGSGTMLLSTTGSQNTAIGNSALDANSSGNNNIAIGYNAASSVSGGNSNNIHIGSVGSSTDSGTIRIGTSGTQTSFFAAGVRGITTGDNDAIPVVIDSNGQLGTVSSSRRFKEDIQDMGGASEGLMRLHPVTFRYKQSFNDGSKPIQYGLIAEEVAEVYPDLVAHSADGQIETVKYQVLDPMLLNEVQRQQAEIQALQEQLNGKEAQRQQAEIRDLRERSNKMKAAMSSMSCGLGTR